VSDKLKPELIEIYKDMISVEDTNFSALKHVNLKDNGVALGTFELDVGGMWIYFPNDIGGAYTDYALLGIGAWLFELNYKHESKPGV